MLKRCLITNHKLSFGMNSIQHRLSITSIFNLNIYKTADFRFASEPATFLKYSYDCFATLTASLDISVGSCLCWGLSKNLAPVSMT